MRQEILTEERLQEIDKRCEAATEGPWESVTILPAGTSEDGMTSWSESIWRVLNGPPQVIREEMLSKQAFTRREDTEFMAHARLDVPQLVYTARVLRLAMEMLTGVLTPLPAGPFVKDYIDKAVAELGGQ